MINNVNRTFTTTPLLVISGHLLNIFVLVDILAEGESATYADIIEEFSISTIFTIKFTTKWST